MTAVLDASLSGDPRVLMVALFVFLLALFGLPVWALWAWANRDGVR